MKNFVFLILLFSFLSFDAGAQTKNRRKSGKTAPKTTAAAAPQVETSAEPVKTETLPSIPGKKNERAGEPVKANAAKTNGEVKKNGAKSLPYYYEFSRPEFVISHVIIEHDADGKGKVTFEKQNLGEPITDPIEISPLALERIKKLFDELQFLDSTETYQSAKYDYPHLGNMTIRFEDRGKRREVKFNWTENKTAENLSKEYKKLTEQYVWIFEINLARENQPLEAPRLIERLETLVKRDEMSDPAQMLPFIREVADDERIPLIARNRAQKVIKLIETVFVKKPEKAEK